MAWDLSANVVAQYKLNDDAANTTVTNEEGADGTLAGGDNTADKSVVGKLNDAFDLDGTNDYIDTNQTFESTFQSSFSIEAWINADIGVDSNFIFGALSTDSRVYFSIYLQKVYVAYQAPTGGTVWTKMNDTIFPSGKTGWYHIVTTIDETNGVLIYVNGVEMDLDPVEDGDMSGVSMSSYNGDSEDTYIGAYLPSGTPTSLFDGEIDNLRIFNKELSATEVGYLYNGGIGTENNATVASSGSIGLYTENNIVFAESGNINQFRYGVATNSQYKYGANFSGTISSAEFFRIYDGQYAKIQGEKIYGRSYFANGEYNIDFYADSGRLYKTLEYSSPNNTGVDILSSGTMYGEDLYCKFSYEF